MLWIMGNHIGRFSLIIALLVGWFLSVSLSPVNILFAAFMLAFLSGSVLLNVFRQELPEAEVASYCWFSGGSFLIMCILLLHTWLKA